MRYKVGVTQYSMHARHTWASGTPAASSVRGRGMGGGEQGGLMLPLLPQGQAPVPNAHHHILKEGGALQADDGPIVRPYTRLAVVWVLLSLRVHTSVRSNTRNQIVPLIKPYMIAGNKT